MQTREYSARSFFILFLVYAAFSVIPANAEDESVGFSYGTVSSISDSTVTLHEYNFEADEEADVAYQIDSETEFEGFKKATEIPVGSEIDIFYEITNGQKIAKSISREEDFEDGSKARGPGD